MGIGVGLCQTQFQAIIFRSVFFIADIYSVNVNSLFERDFTEIYPEELTQKKEKLRHIVFLLY